MDLTITPLGDVIILLNTQSSRILNTLAILSETLMVIG